MAGKVKLSFFLFCKGREGVNTEYWNCIEKGGGTTVSLM